MDQKFVIFTKRLTWEFESADKEFDHRFLWCCRLAKQQFLCVVPWQWVAQIAKIDFLLSLAHQQLPHISIEDN